LYFKEDVKESDDDYMRTYNVMRLGDIAFEGNKSKYFAHGRFVENTIEVPEIRFAGFTDAWEQRKLGEVFTQTSNYVNPKVDDIELWSLTVDDGLTLVIIELTPDK